MMLPWTLGLMHFSQWGGMYTDGWCAIHAWRDATPDTEGKWEYIRAPTTRTTWFASMHTEQSCMAWAQSWCGVEKEPGWIIGNVRMIFNKAHMEHPEDMEINACERPGPASPWFHQQAR